jgi:uncharacterized protein (DUF2141 family)
MKGIILMLVAAGVAVSLSVNAQNSTQTVVISNLDKKKGKVYIGWYNSESNYMKEELIVLQKIVQVNEKEEVSVDFINVKPGTYAISVFLDENENGILDKNSFGIPKENYGFSNNVIPPTRPASFKEASFEVAGKPTTIPIKIK